MGEDSVNVVQPTDEVEEDDVVNLLELAESVKYEVENKENTHSEIRDDLFQAIEEDADKFTEDEFEEMKTHFENQDYEKVREIYYDAMKRAEINFDDEELGQIAETFKQEFEELVQNTEMIKNSLMSLRRSGLGKDDAINLLYGSTSLNKSTIKDVFEAIDELDSTDDSTDQLAPIVASQKSSLNIRETRKVLDKMKEKFDGDGDE